MRGFRNKPKDKPVILNVNELKKLEKMELNTFVKILGNGDLQEIPSVDLSKYKKLSISKSASRKLEKAGIVLSVAKKLKKTGISVK